MSRYFDSPWFSQVRRMRRSDPVYKPALLLAVVDLIDEGLGTPELVPLGIALDRFDELLVKAGIVARSGSLRAFMPAYHLSTASSTAEPFWDLLQAGVALGSMAPPKSNRALLDHADAIRIDESLRDDLATPEGRERVRTAIYLLLEDDGRDECLALLAIHDKNKGEVEERVGLLMQRALRDFRLEDPNARTIQTFREQIIRDRTLRLVVLPEYDFACALCSTRIIWNKLPEVEVAHIKPRSLRGADDPRNALSLCQTHHWAFDAGIWTADDDLRVLVNEPNARGDDLAALGSFRGKALLSPKRSSARPHPDALRWHREHRFERVA